MRNVDFRGIAFVALAGLLAGCSSSPEPRPPRPIPGYVRPPVVDSLIKEGPLAGKIIDLVCDPDPNRLESGDDVRCLLRTGTVEGFITHYAMLDSFPEIRIANPNIVTARGPGRLRATNPGFGQLWATYGGAQANAWVTVIPAQGSVRFVPGIADTTIEVGQSYRFRLAHYDTLGREQLNPISGGMAIGWWGAPGRLDTIGLNLFELTPKEPGRAEITMSRGRRTVSVRVNFVPAVKPLPPAKPNVVPVLVAPRTAIVQIQLIDSAASPREIPIMIGDRVLKTARDGWYRDQSDTGRFVFRAFCPGTAQPGEALRDTSLRFVSGQNPRMRIRFSSAKCALPRENRVQSAFDGFYERRGLDEVFTLCRRVGDFTGGIDTVRRTFIVVDAPDFVPPPLADSGRYFMRIDGTLTGPGSFGADGKIQYFMLATRVWVMRRPNAGDCR